MDKDIYEITLEGLDKEHERKNINNLSLNNEILFSK